MSLLKDNLYHILNELLGDTKNLVILVPDDLRKEARDEVISNLPASAYGSGSTWTVLGTLISIRGFMESIPPYMNPYHLIVCNGGRAPTNEEVTNVQRWRKFEGSVVSFVGA
jgi:hypothetical protein